MLSSFVDLKSLGMFLILSFLFMIAGFRFNFKAMQSSPKKIACIFLVAGIIVGFSDVIVMLQERESNLLAGDNVSIANHMGTILLSPFYGILFAAVTWIGMEQSDVVTKKD